MPDDLAQFADSKYLSLETFRKMGAGVRTPVWFAEAPSSQAQATFYVYTLPDSGKVKRIRNNPSVRIAPYNMRGDVRGEWVGARALVRRRGGWQGAGVAGRQVWLSQAHRRFLQPVACSHAMRTGD